MENSDWESYKQVLPSGEILRCYIRASAPSLSLGFEFLIDDMELTWSWREWWLYVLRDTWHWLVKE